MLRFLSIRHLAVIDRLELEFEPGLNVLTGETGAGKSILVGAVGLLVGGRASADLVRTGEEHGGRRGDLRHARRPRGDRPPRDLRPGPQPRVRRRRARDQRRAARAVGAARRPARPARAPGAARSRDPPRPARRVRRPRRRSATAVAAAFAAWQALSAERDRLARQRSGRSASRAEFLTFQLAEIERVAPQAGEDDELTATRQVLPTPTGCSGSAPTPTRAVRRRPGRAAGARRVWKRLGELAAHRRAVQPVPRRARRRQVAARGSRVLPALVRRGHRRVAGAAAGGRRPPRAARASQEEARPDARRRHRARRRAAARARRRSSTAPSAPPSSTRRSRAARAALPAGARERCRRSGARPPPDFAGALETSLGDLAMARTRCEVRFAPARSEAQWTERGIEQAEFYISPNPGEDLRPLARIASGGELSRIMLALKTLGLDRRAGQDAHLRRGRRRHRRRSRRRRRRPAAAPGEAVPGALHHPPAADRRLRRDALPDREAVTAGPDGRRASSGSAAPSARRSSRG